MSRSRPPIAKGEVAKFENLHAEGLDKKDRHPMFGFKCLHYSVSESVGSLIVTIENKTAKACSVLVKTVDDQAVAGEDFQYVEKEIHFRDGQKTDTIEIGIMDDDSWEPDEDFWV